MKATEKFWANIAIGEPEVCWNWRRHRIRDGYGRVRWHRRMQLTHRIAWELTHGPVPDGLCVLHYCDNPACCNPSHLWLGTVTDNNHDRHRKGRDIHPSGIKHYAYHLPGHRQGVANGRAKLTEDNVREIRACWLVMATTEELADEFGIAKSTLKDILSRKTWSHVHDHDSTI